MPMAIETKINNTLPKGYFRVVCIRCSHVYSNGYGNMTEWAISTMNQPDRCSICGENIILEYNPEIYQNRYDADHPYHG
jgi:hypothetical protein